MKIINLIKRNLLGFIAGAIIFGSIGAYALTVASKDVSYKDTNVESAINDLYSKVNGNSRIITIYSAAGDTIYYYNGSTKVDFCTTDLTGKGLCAVPNNGNVTLYSSVAKNPNNLSNPYSKDVTVTNSTSSIYLMPGGKDNTIYWYGYNGKIDLNAYNQYYSGYYSSNRVGFDINYFRVSVTGQSSVYSYYAKTLTKQLDLSGKSVVKLIGNVETAGEMGHHYGLTASPLDTSYPLASFSGGKQIINFTLSSPKTPTLYTADISSLSSGYFSVSVLNNGTTSTNISAIWYE